MRRRIPVKRLICVTTLLFTLLAGQALAYNLIGADEVKANLDTKTPMVLIDIQVALEFDQHHLPGAIATYAYPVKSEQDTTKLDAAMNELHASDAPVVIVCPRGKGGAERAYDYLKANGVTEERLFILKDGQAGWPYPELVQGK